LVGAVVAAATPSALGAGAATPTGAIEGQVSSESGTDLVGTVVDAYGVTAGASEHGSDTAGLLGNYRIEGLKDGAYVVIFRPNSNSVTRLAPEWWRDTTDWWEAELIRVEGGTTVSNIDTHLDTGIYLRGTVTDPEGDPVPGATVLLSDFQRGWEQEVTTSGVGTYGVFGLPGAEYQLYFMAPDAGQHTLVSEAYDDTPYPSEASTLHLENGGNDVIDAQLDLGGRVYGYVTGPPGGVSVYALDRGGRSKSDDLQQPGYYQIDGLPPGGHRVAFYTDAAGYLPGYAGGAPTAATAEVHLAVAGEPTGYLSGSPREVSCGRNTPPMFDDVGPRHPFCYSIGWLDQADITTGYPDGSFRPTESVTRQSMAAFLYRYPTDAVWPVPVDDPFVDVGIDHPFATEVDWLVETGITEGFPDDRFRPASAVSRQSMAAFLYRLAGEPEFEPVPAQVFSDVPVSHPFFKEIMWLWWNYVADGRGDGRFGPADPVSRQAMARFLRNYDTQLAGPGPNVDPRVVVSSPVVVAVGDVRPSLQSGEVGPNGSRMVRSATPVSVAGLVARVLRDG